MHQNVLRTDEPRIGRRKRNRLRARLPAKVTTIHGKRSTVLLDLSATGARVAATEEMARGQRVMLAWSNFEALGSLVWITGGACGIAFYEPLTAETLIATRDFDSGHRLPGERQPERDRVRDWLAGVRRV